MSKDIEQLSRMIDGTREGGYFLPESAIAKLSVDDMQAANRLMDDLVIHNPSYEFSINRETNNGGYIVQWKLRHNVN